MPTLTAQRLATGDEPTTMPPKSWSFTLTLTMLGLFSAWFGPIQVLLGLQAAQLTPDHKEATLSLVTGLGALVSTLGNPIFGAMSDRTHSRFGRRLPWIAGGLGLGALGLVVLAFSNSVLMMVVGWILVQAFLNAAYAALNASIADQVPRSGRGTISGLLGIGQTAGLVLGSGIAASVGGLHTGYLVLAIFVVIMGLPHVLNARPAPTRGLPQYFTAPHPGWVRPAAAFPPGLWLGLDHPLSGQLG